MLCLQEPKKKKVLFKLQVVQNNGARLIRKKKREKKSPTATPLLEVSALTIQFNVLCYVLMYSWRCASVSIGDFKYISAKKIVKFNREFIRLMNTNNETKIFWLSCAFQLWPPMWNSLPKKIRGIGKTEF